MKSLGVIMARAASKGLPDKCMRALLGQPVLQYTIEHAVASGKLDGYLFTSDSAPAIALATSLGVEVLDRPSALATDTATVDDVARHALDYYERKHGETFDAVVLLYGNIPVRKPGLIDRALELLQSSGADSVRSVAPVSKQHPDWLHRVDGDRMTQYRKNSIHRRQDLSPLYYHDGAVAAVTRAALLAAAATPEDRQSFLGEDRRALIQQPEDAVDIDDAFDLLVAEVILKQWRSPAYARSAS